MTVSDDGIQPASMSQKYRYIVCQAKKIFPKSANLKPQERFAISLEFLRYCAGVIPT